MIAKLDEEEAEIETSYDQYRTKTSYVLHLSASKVFNISLNAVLHHH